ncbi:Glucosamine-6-phosphate deaminase 1 [Maioricimonas rarisocia]|uniref:Glucosamine-6-phosphate deaminase n=1 Tax=Maioricimonas rarisocia TaxID=2528026 RepID=A0A517Z136_9PLAN|nr:glucosamine-6-phosphate deaminase [Maioricimonas rarisocia]QDU36192.1 Glucosamine-6-phosphate deaminase 1 [Maioricimonas rarisocia]
MSMPTVPTSQSADLTDEQPGRLLPGTVLPCVLYRNAAVLARHVAAEVADLIRQRQSEGRQAVLGLPTGSTPIGVYRELIRLHQEEGLDFSNVVTFNLDEYWPMEPDSVHSYHRWMRENFFDHVNVPEENIHIPDGQLSRGKVDRFCAEYEKAIAAAGGIDIQMLGIGRTGHIGFNEPGSSRASRTRLVNLDPVTRRDAASGFGGEENVPLRAVTMGVGTIMDARRVIMMALGEHKAPIVRRSAEDEETAEIPASFLQAHPNATLLLDSAAAAELTAVNTPWEVDCVDWTAELERRAVIWLAEEVSKPILKLEARDFMGHHLTDLVHESGPVENIRQRVFDSLMETICNHPGGKEKQTIIVFSPHPDDDVISMGGTLITLAQQGHDVHIAYMTSGNIAVFDHDALRHVEYVSEYLKMFNLQSQESTAMETGLREALARRGDSNSPEVLKVKGLIRKTEAVCAAETAGVPADHCHFLDMPFYQTGQVKKKPIGDEDVAIVAELIRTLEPAQIYLAGDLSDPHGTHRMCAEAIISALKVLGEDDLQPEAWLYRGAWQEYEPHEIDRAVPLSPEVMLRKKLAIFKHESQKDAALFPGHDEREFWVRAEARTKQTARRYNELGLPEYFGVEAFRRLEGEL